MKKNNGENILVNETLETYIKFKPLHIILLYSNINDDNFKKVNKLINTIEGKIKTGDMFLYKVKNNIVSSLKNGDYNNTINNVNKMYDININNNEIYNSIINSVSYSYNLKI